MNDMQKAAELSDEDVEHMILDQGLTAPRVTPDDISNLIMSAKYHRFENTTTTVCCLILRNGFTVVGESACASMDNFHEELGRQLAFTNAKRKIWPLEGYLLKQRLTEQGAKKAAPDEVSGD